MTRSGPSTDERAVDPFVHEALLYEGHRDYLDYTLRFIYEGLSADEPVMVAAPPANVALLRERLGALADDVRFHDMTVAGRNPARIIPWVLDDFMNEHRGRRVRIVGEPIWVGRTAAEYPVAVQHEAMINAAFTGRAATILCPYDASRLDQQAIVDSELTHPIMVTAGQRVPSYEYDPYGVTAQYNRPLPEPPPGATTLRFEVTDLVKVRGVVGGQAHRVGLTPERTAELQLAVNEVATNSVEHGGGSGTLRTWREHDRVVCEIRDFGYVTDTMIGRLQPPTPDARGYGLVLVHYLCDLVQVHTTLTGTATRMHMLA